MTRPWWCVSRPSGRATCRCSRRRYRFFRVPITRSVRSRRRRSRCRSGSGPYKVGRFEPGRHIEYERVKDWWGADLPVARGQNNFDILRYEYYRDREVAFEGFTARSYLFREEFTSRVWATRYDFPAVCDGRIKRDVIADDTPSGAQGWFFNTRRETLKDKRLREAFVYAFDFEWTNKNIMYGSYERTHSVFQNSDMMAVRQALCRRACPARIIPRQGVR